MNLNELAAEIHGISKAKGFWDADEGFERWNEKEGRAEFPERNRAEVLMLIVSEAAEALEDIRDGRIAPTFEVKLNQPSSPALAVMDGKIFISDDDGYRETDYAELVSLGHDVKPTGLPSEMADIIIRTLDACAAWGIDIDTVVREKIRYNATRERLHGRKR